MRYIELETIHSLVNHFQWKAENAFVSRMDFVYEDGLKIIMNTIFYEHLIYYYRIGGHKFVR